MNKKIKNILILISVSIFSLAIGVSAATIASSSVSYGNTTVKAALDELMAIANQCPSGALCSKVKIGDYVQMTPTQPTYTIPATLTGYDSDQTVNPSELNLWRVIDIKSDGTIETVSENVSSNGVYFKGQQGYLNLVGTLNLIASQYGNSNYTISARHMGYNGQTATITDTSKFTIAAPWAAYTSDNSNETVGGGDIMYEKDTELVTAALGTLSSYIVGTTTKAAYWLASRFYGGCMAPNTYCATGRYILSSNGNIYNCNFYLWNGTGTIWSSTNYLRPIVTLRSDITSFTGSGTSTSPWILS